MVDTQELKLQLGNRAKGIIADGLGLKENRSKLVLCPLHNDKNPSMSWFEDGLMWRCHACGDNIDIYRYYTDFEQLDFTEAVKRVGELVGVVDEKPIKAKKKEYVLPKIDMQELTDPFISYMVKRGITKDTLDHWKVKQRTWAKQDVYVFQYFNERDILEYVTYRGLGKGAIKGGCETNTKAILWGMWHIDKTKPLVITEGQPDAMVVWQSGYRNVVSVPSGTNNLTWIDNCWDWLKDIKEFIVWADNDAPGLKMAENIKIKLGNVKVLIADKKDANEVLFYHGADKVNNLIMETIRETPQGLLDLSNVEYKTLMGKVEDGIETGFYEYDSHVEDWKLGEMTVMFGRNGEGKTTVISQIIAHCLEKGVKTFLYSGEMSEDKIQDWLYRQMVGTNKKNLRTIQGKYRNRIEPLPEVIKKIKEWHKETLYLYDRNEKEITGDLDTFFKIMGTAAKRFGVKLFVIDNLMAILEENADSLFSDQANLVQRCKNFAIVNNVHIVLLAHPNKTKGELKSGEDGNLDKTDISGSNNIPNKADNIISVERLWGEDRDCDAIITSLKDRETGQRKQMRYFFSKESLRFYNKVTKENRIYSWDVDSKLRAEVPNEFSFIDGPNCPF